MPDVQPGSAVSFRLGDAVCLPVAGDDLEIFEAVLQATFRGRVVFTSEAGPGWGAFAAVEVEGLPRRLIVAVDRLAPVRPGTRHVALMRLRPRRTGGGGQVLGGRESVRG